MQSKYIMVRSGETLFRERALQNHCSHPDSSQSSNGIDKIWWCPNRNYDDFYPLTEYLSVSWQLPDDVSIHPSPIETALLSRYMHSISDCVFDMHLSMTELNQFKRYLYANECHSQLSFKCIEIFKPVLAVSVNGIFVVSPIAFPVKFESEREVCEHHAGFIAIEYM